MSKIAWIAADWGTSNLRLWAMGADCAALEARSSNDGMGNLKPDDFEPALHALANDWLTQTQSVIACGMVGSRQGWVEAPYQSVPCAVSLGTLVKAPSKTGLDVRVIPGIRQISPPDVMRGEETQIAGFLATHANWDGVICLPGTHTKWVHISAGEVVSFQTFMTGELFDLLSRQSVLRHSVADQGWDDSAFKEALNTAQSRPESLAGRLFSLRADQLLNNKDGANLRARLSGLLIGAEIAAARPYWLGQRIAVIGANTVTHPYHAALKAQGTQVEPADATQMTLAGLTAAYMTMKDQSCPET